jgi:hypothetical protein
VALKIAEFNQVLKFIQFLFLFYWNQTSKNIFYTDIETHDNDDDATTTTTTTTTDMTLLRSSLDGLLFFAATDYSAPNGAIPL